MEYDRLLQTQVETESAILARSLMKKNADLLEEAISDLEHAKALGFYNSRIAHQLALAYRDNQQWEEAESTVRDLLTKDTAYLENIANATFVADLLRKRQRVKEAYGLLTVIVEQAQAEGKEVPLNTQAILQELQHAANQPEYCQEVSRYYYDAIYAQSEKYQADPEHSVYLPVWGKVVAILKQEGVQRVLDIGCGPGQFAEYLLKQIPDIHYQGVDFSQTAIETARLRCPTAQFYVKDLMQEEALKEFKADAFVMLEVLEHIEKDLELIARIPIGQKVIFSVPNMDSFGHVRFFVDCAAISNRYDDCFDAINIETVILSGRSKIHLAVATRRIKS
jgi:SAM-dependent methyltransferase